MLFSDTAPGPQPGLFISFEGGDGVGKSTQVQLLSQWFIDQGREVITTREPGGTALGAEIRKLLLHGDDVSPRSEALLYAADRAHHVATLIRPALERGAVVITDRYLDSSVAYQAGGRELSESAIEELSLWATDALLPSRTFLLDLDLHAAATRLEGAPDRLERAGIEFHQRTRDAFLRRAAADPLRWRVIDASQSPEEIATYVQSEVSR